MTGEQISKIGEEAMVKFGVDKDTLMLLLLSGKQEFKDWIFDEASKIFNNKMAVQTALLLYHNIDGKMLCTEINRRGERRDAKNRHSRP